MNPGNKTVMKAGGETKTATASKSKQDARQSFANRKNGNGQDEKKFAQPVKSEQANTQERKEKSDAATQFAMNGIMNSFDSYFPLEEKHCRVIY